MIPVVPKEGTYVFPALPTCGLLLLINNVKSYWWSFLPLTYLTDFSSMSKTKYFGFQSFQMRLIEQINLNGCGQLI